eukprot:1150937-Pelagomonas_calceolata.AAC.1
MLIGARASVLPHQWSLLPACLFIMGCIMSLQAASRRILLRAARSVTCMAKLTIVCSNTMSIVQQLAWSNSYRHNKC